MTTWLAVLAIGIGSAMSSTAAAATDGSVETVIDREMAASGVPGMAYAVVADGEVTALGARGVVRKGGATRVTPDTPFSVGSVSKSFTALAIMQLVEAGAVDLDAPVSRYLDRFVGQPGGIVTIRQLLGHTSGFSTVQGNRSHGDVGAGDDQLARQVDAVAATTPAYAPGERWEYSNTNYQVLGRVVEVVSGDSYQSYVTANILEPIGMDDSFVADGDVHLSMATGHRPWFGTKRPVGEQRTDRVTAPQGGIIASAADLARYMQVMMNGRDDVLSAAGKAQMMRSADGASPGYGFGWFLDPDRGTVGHSGLTPGFESRAVMVPGRNAGVVVLVNANGGIGFGETGALLEGITAAALGLDGPVAGSHWSRKALFLMLVALPVIYILGAVWAWVRRDEIRAKASSGASGVFSLWFPLLTTTAAAWVLVWLMPNLFGAPIATLRLFQPDFGLASIAAAVLGVLWALFRLGVAYGRSPWIPAGAPRAEAVPGS